MKFHQLVVFLFLIYTSICIAASDETDEEVSFCKPLIIDPNPAEFQSTDQSLGQEVEFRQPFYLLKRDADKFWQLFFRPTGYPQPSNYGQMLPLGGLKGKLIFSKKLSGAGFKLEPVSRFWVFRSSWQTKIPELHDFQKVEPWQRPPEATVLQSVALNQKQNLLTSLLAIVLFPWMNLCVNDLNKH